MLDNQVDDFAVIFSGKSSKKVDGLYHPEKREIIIHNKNMTSDSEILYTGLHEFAHHIHFCRSAVPVSNRSHTGAFWDIFHTLLIKAEQVGLYNSPFETVEEFVNLTGRIKKDFIGGNIKLMKELGSLLIQAMELCKKYRVSFEDYVDRVLQIHRTSAKTIMQVSVMDTDPGISFENRKTLSRIKDPDSRREAEEAFISGQTPDMVKSRYLGNRNKSEETDPVALLEKEKTRLKRSIETMRLKLEKIEARITELKTGEE